MPSFEFRGFVPTLYPFDRDALDQPVGEVQPGEVREFDEAPDWQWIPAGGSQAAASDPGSVPAAEATPEPEAAAEAAADGPQPAPPAVAPPAAPSAFAVTPGT